MLWSASGLHFPEDSAGRHYVGGLLAASVPSGGPVGSEVLPPPETLDAGATWPVCTRPELGED